MWRSEFPPRARVNSANLLAHGRGRPLSGLLYRETNDAVGANLSFLYLVIGGSAEPLARVEGGLYLRVDTRVVRVPAS